METPKLTKVSDVVRHQHDENGEIIMRVATCGTCGRSWNDADITHLTPAPAGRCPFEYEHVPTTCHTCLGSGDLDDGDECPACHGEGDYGDI